MYVNGYIIPVPEDKKDAYKAVAEKMSVLVKEYGAVEIYENWEKEVPDGEQTDFRRSVKAKSNEKIVFSWIVWPDRITADTAHKEMFEDPRLQNMGDMPFDGKRLVMGGFEPILSFHKD